MATDISAAIATQLDRSSSLAVQRARSALITNRTTAATPSRNTASPLDLSVSARNDINLSASNAATALGRSLSAGTQIVSRLRALEAQLTTAINDGLVSPRTELRIDETRVSRLNINVAAGRTLDAIDRLVSQTETAGINLISSDQERVTIQTTEFGGRVSVRAQPLDSTGLSLLDLNALSQNDAIEARARVRIAIDVAEERIGSLNSLRQSLEFRGGTAQSFLQFNNEGLFEGAVRGRLVNLTA